MLDAQAASAGSSAISRGRSALPRSLRAFADGVGAGPGEAWVAYEDRRSGGSGLQFPFIVPPGSGRAARGVESGTVTIDAEISDVGADVTIGVPEGGGFQPIEDLTDRLESLASLGGL